MVSDDCALKAVTCAQVPRPHEMATVSLTVCSTSAPRSEAWRKEQGAGAGTSRCAGCSPPLACRPGRPRSQSADAQQAQRREAVPRGQLRGQGPDV